MMVDGGLVGWAKDSYFLVDHVGTTASLFNIRRDPQQKDDLGASRPELVKQFQTKARSFLQLSVKGARRRGPDQR